jgi:hypothetical protein
LSKEYRKELGNYHFRLSGGKVFDTLVKYGDFLQSWNDIQKVAEKWAIKEAPEEVGIQTNALEFFAKSVMRFLHNK